MSEMYFPQIDYLELDNTFTGSTELFPTVWQALEGLASPEVADRNASLDSLLETEAPKFSPLVAYNLATRLIDPDIKFRARIIEALGNVIAPATGPTPPPEVRRHLKAHCMEIGRGMIIAILEVAVVDTSVESHIATLFNLCSHSGTILIDLMADRKVPVSIRQQAIYFIGRVGFIEAIPYLDRLADRLTSRAKGQRRMPFAPLSEPDEFTLISAAQATMTVLKEK